jgi:hypothetical protein
LWWVAMVRSSANSTLTAREMEILDVERLQ